jgi:succinyl-diaminopimelate desuccinylase
MEVVELTKKLVSIASYVDGKLNEKELGIYLKNYLDENLPWLQITTQNLNNGRFNIIAIPNDTPKVLFLAHMDTVTPVGERDVVLSPVEKEDKLFGLGTADMKSGLAAALIALKNAGKEANAGIILDCDEEYYFEGAKKLQAETSLKPGLLVCPEPTSFEIINGCRGVVEIGFDVFGKTVHAGCPEKGINAIEVAVRLVDKLKIKLNENVEQSLGSTSVNLATLNGGRKLGEEIISQPNAVADVARVVLDIRQAGVDQDAKYVFGIVDNLAKDFSVKIGNKKTNIDYPPYITPKEELRLFEKSVTSAGIDLNYQDLSKTWFFESALFCDKWECPGVVFGPKGEGHKADESVEIKSVLKVQRVFENLINSAKDIN